jgi:hypothetical protein
MYEPNLKAAKNSLPSRRLQAAHYFGGEQVNGFEGKHGGGCN